MTIEDLKSVDVVQVVENVSFTNKEFKEKVSKLSNSQLKEIAKQLKEELKTRGLIK